MVDLNHIELATEQDKAYGIYYWAALFKAKTWEELRMLANNNEALKEAAENLYIANSDEIVRQQCRAREDAERRERTLERNNRLLKEKLEKVQQTLVEKDDALNAKNKALAEKDNELNAKEKALAEKDDALNAKDKVIVAKDSVIAEKDLEILRLKALLENKE